MFGIRLLWSGEIIEPLWSASVLFHVLIQTLLLAWLLRPQLIHKPLRFWFIVSLYTTYPVLLESLTGPPFIIYGHSNIWPLALIWYQPGSWVTTAPSYFNSIIYYLWMAGLIVIAYQRLPHRRRWHSLWLIALLPVITIASAYSARYVIDGIDWFIG